jgi:hypothetical protein
MGIFFAWILSSSDSLFDLSGDLFLLGLILVE